MGENKILAQKQSRGGLNSPRPCDAVSALHRANLQLNNFPDSDHLDHPYQSAERRDRDLGKPAGPYQKATDQGIKVREAT